MCAGLLARLWYGVRVLTEQRANLSSGGGPHTRVPLLAGETLRQVHTSFQPLLDGQPSGPLVYTPAYLACVHVAVYRT